MQTEAKYILGGDILRTVAIIAVIVIHITTNFVNYAPLFEGPTWWVANLLDSASRVAVPLFIMLSGSLLLDKEKVYPLVYFMKKRLSRIGIPIVFWIVGYFLWRIFFWHDNLNITDQITTLLSGGVYYHLYFLFVIIGLYLVTPILKVYTHHTTHRNLTYFVVLSFLYGISIQIINFTFQKAGIVNNAFTMFIPYIAYFITGYYLKDLRVTKQQGNVLMVSYTILTFLTSLLNYWYMKAIGWERILKDGLTYNRYFYDHFSPNVVIMTIIAFILFMNAEHLFPIVKKGKLPKVFQHIARLSFGIYIFHPMVMDYADVHWYFNLTHIPRPILGFMLVKILLVFLLSYIVVLIGKRIPGIQAIWG